ncbi:MAG TPA: hypothetical protein VJJ46_06485 [Anaerolineales bacterium]|nr:hypothetical protein [Anaerolineales bacterium]
MGNVNFVLDFILVAAAISMVLAVRGLGGVVGKTLNLITIGAIITGLAHLLATLQHRLLPIESSMESFIHRMIVLIGFILLVVGFQQVRQLRA